MTILGTHNAHFHPNLSGRTSARNKRKICNFVHQLLQFFCSYYSFCIVSISTAFSLISFPFFLLFQVSNGCCGENIWKPETLVQKTFLSGFSCQMVLFEVYNSGSFWMAKPHQILYLARVESIIRLLYQHRGQGPFLLHSSSHLHIDTPSTL